jgi:hypothetical protein
MNDKKRMSRRMCGQVSRAMASRPSWRTVCAPCAGGPTRRSCRDAGPRRTCASSRAATNSLFNRTEASHRQFCTSCGTRARTASRARNGRRPPAASRASPAPLHHVHYGEKVMAVKWDTEVQRFPEGLRRVGCQAE